MLQIINKYFLPIPKLLYLSLSMVFYSIHQCRGDFLIKHSSVNKSSLANYLSFAQAVSFFFGLKAAAYNDASGRQKLVMAGSILLSIILFQGFFVLKGAIVFWTVYTCYFSLLSITMPILDKVVLDYLENNPHTTPRSYGNQRVFSTFGFIITNYIVEGLTKTRSKDLNYTWINAYNYVAGGIAIGFILLFVKNIPVRVRQSSASGSIATLLKNPDYMYFIFIILLSGITRASMTTYLSLYYKEVLELTKKGEKTGKYFVDFFYGNKVATTAFFGNSLEILIFFSGGFIITRLGLFWPILISQFCQFGRFLLYYGLDTKGKFCFENACLIELLKGANYGLLQTAAVQLATKLCPIHLRSSSQVLFTGSFVALGTVFSGLLFSPFFSKETDLPKEVLCEEYRKVFLVDTVITVLIVILFVFKYAIKENLLFSRENYEEKFRIIEEEHKIEEEAINDLEQEGLIRDGLLEEGVTRNPVERPIKEGRVNDKEDL